MKKLFEIGSWSFLVLLIVIVILTFIRIRDINQITDDAYDEAIEKISSVNREDGVSDVEGYGLILTSVASGIGVGGLIIIYAGFIIESFVNFISVIISFVFYRLFLWQYNSSGSKTKKCILGTIFFIIFAVLLGVITYISYCFNIIFKALDTIIAIEGILSLALLVYIIVIALIGIFKKKESNENFDEACENENSYIATDANKDINADSNNVENDGEEIKENQDNK